MPRSQLAVDPPRPRAAGGRQRRDIQGLRALAVLGVVAYHARVPGITGGYAGVDVFYVLSGFLITSLLVRELRSTGGLDVVAFYARRVRRLLPAAVLVLVVTAVGSVLLLPPLRAEVALTDVAWAAAYAANLRFAFLQTDYLASTSSVSPVQHFWSLGVEEQFYLVWPVLVWLAVANRRRPVLVLGTTTLASFLFGVYLTKANQPWAFFGLPTRAWELGVGALVAVTLAELRRVPRLAAALVGWAGLAAVLASFTVFDDSTAFPGTAALLPVLGTAAVLAAGTALPRAGAPRLLASRPLQPLGDWSYGWYLWHWPLLVLGAAAAGGSLAFLPRLALAVASLLLAATTSWWVEARFRFARTLVRHSGRSLSAGALLTATALAVAAFGTLLLPPLHGTVTVAAPPSLTKTAVRTVTTDPLLTRVEAAVATGVNEEAVPANLDPPLEEAHADKAPPFVDGCHLSWTDTYQPRCGFGYPAGNRTVVLFGDSHATQWFPGLDAAARARHWRLKSLTKATCPPLLMDLWSPNLGHEYWQCTSWRQEVVRRITAEHPALVVLGMARHYGPEYRFSVYGSGWLAGLRAMVAQLHRLGVPVLVLGPTPLPNGDVPECLSGHLTDAMACDLYRAAAVNAGGVAAERAATVAAGGRYLDVTPWTCTPLRCAVLVGNLLVFRDDNHLTSVYPRWLAPLLGRELASAMAGSSAPAAGMAAPIPNAS